MRHLIVVAFSLLSIAVMIFLNLKLIPLSHRTDELIEALRLQMGRTQIQPGCIKCRLSQDTQEQNIVLYEEVWKSWEKLESHIRSDRFLWILELMEHSSHKPELSFSDVREVRGMEYVRKLRTVIPKKIGRPG